MRIILLGAGSIGWSLTYNLAQENNDIVIVDVCEDRLIALKSRLDVATICGHASHPNVLRKAGANDADLVIAVTDSDEINILACQIAHTVFNVPKKICRIRAQAYRQNQALLDGNLIPIDVIISPEQLATQYIEQLLHYPGSLQVLSFADDRLKLVVVRAYYGAPIVGQALRNLREHMPGIDARVTAVYRRGDSLIPDGDTVIEVDDEVFVIAATDHIPAVIGELRGEDSPYRRIIIAGGGHIGGSLAKSIESRYQVKIIDNDLTKCSELSGILNNTIILHGDPSDQELLLAENIETCDVFCALTDDDEDNIMASLLAKKLGVGKVVTLVSNAAYVDLMQVSAIDVVLSVQQIATNSLLKHVRRVEMANVYSLRHGGAEAIEIVTHGTVGNSKVVGKTIGDIKLPDNVTIGALVRSGDVMIAHSNIVVQSGDHVILFLLDRSHVSTLEKLFQVKSSSS